ncbi:MAG TPA: RNA polymerase sigma factor region1.1 domain-containing protein, partial [Ramlibacter sp.]|nr:RNA polymerase sigma factor region1.1 domain-containing protein [Ramlibacter sp.]
MPVQKSVNPAPAGKPDAKKPVQPGSAAKPSLKVVKTPAAEAKTNTKEKPVPSSSKSTAPKTDKAAAKDEPKKTAKAAVPTAEEAKKKPGRPPKAAAAEAEAPPKGPAGAKRGRKPKAETTAAAGKPAEEEEDLSDIEAEFAEEEPAAAAETEKVKPLRMKISKAKERALMKEFGLDETVLSEEEMARRRQRLKTLITLGKTRGYLTHAEITDHLPEKLVDAETLEVVVTMLNDLGVAVYEQTPDAEMLLLNNTTPTSATVEEAEEEAEAALSTVDSEFGRTTDPVRMYMREMGTVELLTREGEIEIAKRI